MELEEPHQANPDGTPTPQCGNIPTALGAFELDPLWRDCRMTRWRKKGMSEAFSVHLELNMVYDAVSGNTPRCHL